MADNVSFTPGAGGTLAADDIDGVSYPRSKLGWGADGSYADVSAATPVPTQGRRAASANYGAMSVDDTATGKQIIAENLIAVGTTGARVWVVIYNNGANPMAIGDDTSITYASGMMVWPGGQTPPLPATCQWRGICDTGKSTDARYLELVE